MLHDFGTPCPKRVCLAAVEDGIAQTLVGALHVLASTAALPTGSQYLNLLMG